MKAKLSTTVNNMYPNPTSILILAGLRIFWCAAIANIYVLIMENLDDLVTQSDDTSSSSMFFNSETLPTATVMTIRDHGGSIVHIPGFVRILKCFRARVDSWRCLWRHTGAIFLHCVGRE
jgi:hypothetical protein